MNVTVAEVLAGAEARAVPLSAECVGYLVLAAADQVSAAPRRLEPNDVLLFEDGGIRVASGRAADGSLAERDLRAVLDALLVRASAPTSGLLRASRRAPGGGIEALVRELETALIPVNRSAAKRSLARLERETVRALQSGRISVPPPVASTAEVSPEPGPVARAPVVPGAPRASAPSPEVVPEIPELSVAPKAATVHERSTVPPPIASVAPPRAELHEPVLVPVSVLAPPLEHTQQLELPAHAGEAVAGETVVLAPVAPKSENDPQLVETRPEPVVQRASAKPPAPMPSPNELVRTEPLTFVRTSTAVGAEPLVKTPPTAMAVMAVEAAPSETAAPLPVVALESAPPPQVTPLLGTRVQRESELPPVVVASAENAVAAVPSVELPHEADAELEFIDDSELELAFDDDGDVDVIEVHFDSNPPPPEPVQHEVVAEASELTEPCPPPEVESLLPPALVPVLEESIPLAVVVETKLPPVVTQAAAPETFTPPPRIALPKPRPSDVTDLLRRLEEEPLSDAELRSGLRNLAGMEPTPPPPGLSDES